MKLRKILGGVFLGAMLLTGSSSVNAANPEGYFDLVQSDSPNQIRVKGWAFDRDNVNYKVRIHVYVGGGVGAKVPSYEIKADKYRPDVNRVHQGVGNNHGFDSVIKVDGAWTGNQTIHIYALNDVGSGTFVELGSKTVNIKTNNRVTNHNPQGQVFQVDSPSDYTLHVKGRAWDDDNPNGTVRVHVYVGGTPGSSVPQYEIRADKANHTFEDTRNIGNSKTGNQTVHIYALNDHGPGTFQEIWSGNVNIKSSVSSRQQNMASAAESMLGSTKYNGYCQAFVKDVGVKIGLPAASAGNALGAFNKWKVSNSMDNIPVGAAVYLRSKKQGTAGYIHGHVGIYVGNGYVVHALSTVRKDSLSYLLSKTYNYLGWGWQAGVDLR
ncbi:MAG: C40 family peptidase [Selenomonadaceae bacterium]|nr:C40 family peptidase [Selenomonadaceae bacterium]